MGVFFITPLRRFLIVEEHGELVFPEAMAAAEVLVAGSVGGSGFKTVVTGIGAGGIYKFVSGGLAFWPESAAYTFTNYQGTQIGLDALASLLGVGFIIGTKVSALMFGGGVIAWFALIPMMRFMGSGLTVPIFPGTIPISEMSAGQIWSNYIRYIGTGAVATGGIISLARSLPTIIASFRQAIAGMGGKDGGKVERINVEAPLLWVVGAAVFGFLATWLIPAIGGGLLGGISALVFSFFFAVVSARMVGIIGASSNPVSGMTIATLLVVTTLLKITGVVGDEGIKTALLISGVVCVAIAVAGGTAQSLKTTFIIGGTPRSVQIGMFVALSIAAFAAGGVVLLLDKAYGIGTPLVAAPQASLMRLIVEGIMTAQLPWTLVIVGAAIAIFCALAGIPILPVALGIYLPISLSSPVLIGGIIRKIVENKFKDNEKRKEGSVERGVLLASGLVAGDALIGILIAVLAVLEVNIGLGARLFPALSESSLLSFIMFMVLGTWVYIFAIKKNKDVE